MTVQALTQQLNYIFTTTYSDRYRGCSVDISHYHTNIELYWWPIPPDSLQIDGVYYRIIGGETFSSSTYYTISNTKEFYEWLKKHKEIADEICFTRVLEETLIS